MDKTIITSYTNPDLDGVACSVAYSELLGKSYMPVIYGTPEKEVLFIFQKFGIGLPKKNYIPQKNDKVIIVDNSTITRHPKEIDPGNVIEIIDHRPYQALNNFINAKAQIELVGAAATIIAEKFRKQKIMPSKKSAILLCGGIISNTLNFQAKITTKKDKKMFNWLNEFAMLPKYFANEMFGAKSNFTKEELLNMIVEDIRTPSDRAGKMVSIAQIEMINAEDFINQYKYDLLKTLTQIKNKTNAEIIFISFVELEKGVNIFLSPDEYSKQVISSIFQLEFSDGVASRNGLILRKEIVPLLIEYLEN